MRNPSERYLRDVLGVTSVLVSNESLEVPAAKSEGHFLVTGDFSASTAVVSFTPVSVGERELCQKMIMAVGAGPLLLIEFSSVNDSAAFSEFFGAFKGKSVWSFGKPSSVFLESAKGLRCLELPTLFELTDQASPDVLMAKKREVWAKIQNFVKDIS